MQDNQLVSIRETAAHPARLDPVLRNVLPGGPSELETQRMQAEAERNYRLREGLRAELEAFALQRQGTAGAK